MAKRKTTYYRWSAKIQRESLPALQEMAGKLGFTVDTPGGFQGIASPPAMLDALAAAYQRDPAGVTLALRVIGVHNLPDTLPPVDPYANP
jgi:hypothetical protein